MIADDDVSIHGVWDERFRRSMPEVKIQHVSSPKDMARLLNAVTKSDVSCYLVDFEFLGEKETGTDLIERLNIAEHAVLVTSRFEEEVVLVECQRLGIRMIPKSAAQHVPIKMRCQAQALALDAAFLDDDDLIRKSWAMAAKRAGIRLNTYANEHDLIRDLAGFPPTLPIYVDFDLKTAKTGRRVAENLVEKSFTKVFLATGFPSRDFDGSERMAGVVGKVAPF